LILVDTSVWIDHFRKGNSELQTALHEGRVLGHPLVIGECACGNLKNRSEILSLLRNLPLAKIAEFEECLFFIHRYRLYGMGIGFTDVHLLASSRIGDCKLWTLDRKLHTMAVKLQVA